MRNLHHRAVAWASLSLLAAACSSDEGSGASHGSGGAAGLEAGTSDSGGAGGAAISSGGAGAPSGTAGTLPGGAAASGGRASGGGAPVAGGAQAAGGAAVTPTRSCANPDPSWLFCEDFERGAGDWDAFVAGSAFLDSPGVDDRGRVTLTPDAPHGGGYALYMPAEASSGYQGASLDWYACEGEQRANCPLRSFDTLYFRAWVRFAPDHRYIHHFLSIGGSHPDDFWPHGTAGCLPNGSLDMGTTVDYHEDTHESFFYTYTPTMACDTRCERYADVASICAECEAKGLPTCTQQPQCCWGENMEPPTPKPFPVGEWFCLELMMHANTVGSSDGHQEYYIDDTLTHSVDGLAWRTDPELALNRVRLQHYIETSDAGGFSNRVSFDDMVVSTERIGCE